MYYLFSVQQLISPLSDATMANQDSSAGTQNQSIYADQEADGQRVQVATLDGYKTVGSASQILDCYAPFLFDWDKAAKNAGVRPLQIEEM